MIDTSNPAVGTAPALRVRALSKAYPGTRALHDVSFDVQRGEIHALVGSNGSGKSTLIKILAGVERGDDGSIGAGGHVVPAHRTSPQIAELLGLRFVHQQPAAFPDLSVAENLAVGRSFGRRSLARIPWHRVEARSQRLLDRYGVDARADTLLGALRPAEQMMVAIVRALQDVDAERTAILVLDEPTAALHRREVDVVLDAIGRFRATGHAVLYVSHRLDEVLGISDHVTVLRDGECIGTDATAELDQHTLVSKMLGRHVSHVRTESTASDAEVLRVEQLCVGPVREVSFGVRRGEILGIAGLLGGGASEVLLSLFGALPIESGRIVLDGTQRQFASPLDAIAAGIAYVPEDRMSEAVFADMTVAENITLAGIAEHGATRRLRHGALNQQAQGAIADFNIRTRDEHTLMSTLSGGNQQKVVLARWLAQSPRVLLLNDPTIGVDVGARSEIYDFVRQAVDRGMAVVVTSSDLDELSLLCHRVLVMADGRLTGEVDGDQADAATLTELIYTGAGAGA